MSGQRQDLPGGWRRGYIGGRGDRGTKLAVRSEGTLRAPPLFSFCLCRKAAPAPSPLSFSLSLSPKLCSHYPLLWIPWLRVLCFLFRRFPSSLLSPLYTEGLPEPFPLGEKQFLLHLDWGWITRELEGWGGFPPPSQNITGQFHEVPLLMSLSPSRFTEHVRPCTEEWEGVGTFTSTTSTPLMRMLPLSWCQLLSPLLPPSS